MRRSAKIRCLWPVVSVLSVAAGSVAGEPAGPPARAEDVYAVAPGDTISVSVFGRDDLSCRVRVPREGRAMLPGAGVVQVAGLGVEELSRRIARLLEVNEQLIEARVSVSICSYGVRRAFVYGAAAEAKSVELPAEAELTLTQAVATCGGFAQDADRAHVRITRRTPGQKPRVIVIDASRIALGLAPELDPPLEPGDVVYIPLREPVYLLGQVQKQGPLPVPFEYPLTVSKAVALSGGFTPFARPSRVLVTRRTAAGAERFTVDVGSILVAGEVERDMELAPGDMVYVPERVF